MSIAEEAIQLQQEVSKEEMMEAREPDNCPTAMSEVISAEHKVLTRKILAFTNLVHSRNRALAAKVNKDPMSDKEMEFAKQEMWDNAGFLMELSRAVRPWSFNS